MESVRTVERVEAHVLDLPLLPPKLVIAAVGTVATSGWTAPRLSPRYYPLPPSDGIWDFEFIADAPDGIVLEVILPIAALFVGERPPWCKGVRVHAAAGSVVDRLRSDAKAAYASLQNTTHAAVADASLRRYERTLGVYDDSHQPTGGVKFEGFPPMPHFEFKKLRHEIVLAIQAPDEDQIRRCVEDALKAAVGVALITAIATGGIGLSAAIGAFIAYLENCVANATVRIDDRSHWIYWWT